MTRTTTCAGSILLAAALVATGCSKKDRIEPMPEEKDRTYGDFEQKKAQGRLAEQSYGFEEMRAKRAAFAQSATSRLDAIAKSTALARGGSDSENARLDAVDRDRQEIATAVGRAFDVSAIEWESYELLNMAKLDALDGELKKMREDRPSS